MVVENNLTGMCEEELDKILEGNKSIETAIEKYKESLKTKAPWDPSPVLEEIRQRMNEDGCFLFAASRVGSNDSQPAFRTITTKNGLRWFCAFTSRAEYDKLFSSVNSTDLYGCFIVSTLRDVLQTSSDRALINMGGKMFMLTGNMIRAILETDGRIEFVVPDNWTEELLDDGDFLKCAAAIHCRNPNRMNLDSLCEILRHCKVWTPCRAIDGKEEQKAEGQTNSTSMEECGGMVVPEIRQEDDTYYFLAFTTEKEMGKYGEERFIKLRLTFPEIVFLARNNEKPVRGIGFNLFTKPFLVGREMFDLFPMTKESSGEEEQDESDLNGYVKIKSGCGIIIHRRRDGG